MLYIVATPIGNLEDITIRALKVIGNADLVLAEDTRRAGILLNRYKIKKPLLSFYDYNKKGRTTRIIKELKENKQIVLISEAGTPGVSDPGFFLLRKCVEQKISFTALPGPTAVINALVLSALASDSFYFVGFAPVKKGKRLQKLKDLSKIKTTLIFFESRYRVISLLLDLKTFFPDKTIALAREMTKLHEETIRGDIDSVILGIKKNKSVKGEFTIVIDNR